MSTPDRTSHDHLPPDPGGDAEPDFAEISRPAAGRLDPVAVAGALQTWLRDRDGGPADTVVSDVRVPAANGMSSETVLFDATGSYPDGAHTRHLVARVAPCATDFPVFPSYDMAGQFRTMRAAAEHSDAPVPRVLWSEDDPAVLGAPFFVMERVDGEIPPDVMPYTFGSWVSEGSEDDRARMQSASVRVLASLHGIADPAAVFAHLRPVGSGPVTTATALREHLAAQRAYYEWASADTRRSPLIENAFDHLEARIPDVPGEAVLTWGDSRIGNVVYRDFVPVGVLDWEMAALGPRELDLGWMIFLHRFFQDLAGLAQLPGLPTFLRREDVAQEYRTLTGYTPVDLDFFTLYAAVRHAVIMFRIQSRAVAFGALTAPEDPDDLIMHRGTVEAMLAGTYWTGVAQAQTTATGEGTR